MADPLDVNATKEAPTPKLTCRVAYQLQFGPLLKQSTVVTNMLIWQELLSTSGHEHEFSSSQSMLRSRESPLS